MALNPEVFFPGKITPSTSAYPYGSARNITTPGDGTGTPYVAALVNDLFGFQQALLTQASIVPSNNAETALQSQYLDALNNLFFRKVSSVADLTALSLKSGDFVQTDSYFAATSSQAAKGGGKYQVFTLSEWQALSGLTTPDGFGDHVLNNGNVARLFRDTINICQYGADSTGVNDTTANFQAAVDNVGGTIYVPEGTYLIEGTVRVLKDIRLFGAGIGVSTIDVRTRAFKFGRDGVEPGGRVDVYAVVDGFTWTDKTTTQGHKSQLYGSSNPGFAFSSINTSIAGCLDSTGSANAVSTAIDFVGSYAPSVVQNCFFFQIGKGVQVSQQYGHHVKDNRFLFCNVGIQTGGEGQAVTTVQLNNNTVERCAVGVFLAYPSQSITVHENVIEANYGGCDCLIFNIGDEIRFTHNYMEASPQSLVIRGDSTQFFPNKIYIFDNFGLSLYVRAILEHVYIERNGLGTVNFDNYVASRLRNINFADNYAGPTEDPFDTSSIIFNSVADNFYDEFTFNNISPKFVPAVAGNIQPYLNLMNEQKSWAASSTAGLAVGMRVSVPNVTCDVGITVEATKYRGGQTHREVVYKGSIKRTAGQGVTGGMVLLSDTEIPDGSVSIAAASAAPSITVESGAASETQIINLNFLNAAGGGSTAAWVYDVRILKSFATVHLIGI